jgi:tetratricopeptide (TPR) repeat protein
LLKHFDANRDAGNATVVARTVLLAPEAVADLAPALKLVSGQQPKNGFLLTTRGGLLLRAGKYAEAVTELQKAAAQKATAEAPVAKLLLALAYHKQGKTEEAKRALEAARFVLERETTLRQAGLLFGGAGGLLPALATTAVKPSPPRWAWATLLELRLLRQEAEEALKRDAK